MISEWLEDFRGDVGSYFKPYVSSENLAVELAGRAGRGIANGVIDMIEGNVGVVGLVDPRHAYQVFHDARTFSNYVMSDPGNDLANAIDGVEQYFDETSNMQMAEDVLRLGGGYYSGAVLGGAGVVGPTYRSGTKILGAIKSEITSPSFGVLNAIKATDIEASALLRTENRSSSLNGSVGRDERVKSREFVFRGPSRVYAALEG